MYRACSHCGKIHSSKIPCKARYTPVYTGGEERELRNTYQWHKKAEEIKERSNYLCAVCKENNEYVYNNLEVHHIIKLREAPNKLLDNYNLICLCTSCHKKADKGEIDAEYLSELARKREKNEG